MATKETIQVFKDDLGKVWPTFELAVEADRIHAEASKVFVDKLKALYGITDLRYSDEEFNGAQTVIHEMFKHPVETKDILLDYINQVVWANKRS